MRRPFVLVLFYGLLACAVPLHPADARPIGVWTYADLLKAADEAIIAKAEGSTDTKDVLADWPDKENYVGMNTKFKVQAPVKGDLGTGKTVQVLHFRLKDPAKCPPNGPRFASFRSEPLTLELAKGKYGLETPSYLLFLKRRADGRYEIVTGQSDSVDGVRALLPTGVLPAAKD